MTAAPEAHEPIWDYLSGSLDARKRISDLPFLCGRALGVSVSFVELLHQTLRSLSNDGARRKNCVGAGLAQQREVLARDHAADGDHRLVKTELAERPFQSRHEREVTGGERRDADDVGLPLGRQRRHFLGRRKQRPDFDVEPEIRERRGNDLLPAIMSVLSHFSHQNAGSAPLVFGKSAGHCDHALVGLSARPRLGQIDAGNGPNFRYMTAEGLLQRQ